MGGSDRTVLGGVGEESLPFRLMGVLAVGFAGIATLFLCLFTYQAISGPIGAKPAPSSLYLVMWLVFSFGTFLLWNARRLVVRVTADSITARFGVMKHTVHWENAEGCHIDGGIGLKYGGWGIRIGRGQGRWTLVFSVVGCPRVVLSLKKGIFRQFAFSTRNPTGLIGIAERMASKLR